MSFLLVEKSFQQEDVIRNGNRFLIGNGVFGYRGTLDEYSIDEKVALNVIGVYDQVDDLWRESINLYNPFFTRIYEEGLLLHPAKIETTNHKVTLDTGTALFTRSTTYGAITITSSRFLSMADKNVAALRVEITAAESKKIMVETGIDQTVWSINGDHLTGVKTFQTETEKSIEATTQECGTKVGIKTKDTLLGTAPIHSVNRNNLKDFYEVTLTQDDPFVFERVVTFKIGDDYHYYSNLNIGFSELYQKHKTVWENLWEDAGVIIEGDEKAKQALTYSIYHLLILTPSSDYKSIPARGVSSQVYKGAIFWDTEIFMLPFFLNTNPEKAKHLLMYRINTLEGAKRKAKEYGYKGAFYAWESQETGDDACTEFNVTDVFTQRPVRTYFRDKQIHISGDVVYGIMKYFQQTNDESIFTFGGYDVIDEVVTFYLDYLYQDPLTKQYEILDVVGPDEYHERVHNNAFTNTLVRFTLSSYITVTKLLNKKITPSRITLINDVIEKLKSYTFKDDIIEQFDGYFQLEDTTVNTVQSRLVHPNEYWGGSNGVATATQIIKQADVITMMYLFQGHFDQKTLLKNFEYYIKRTEHGSSLSSSMYALIACKINKTQDAYPLFMKTASVDLFGRSKEYAGTIYIGGTHPAASGGAYMTAIFGFAGVSFQDNQIHLEPHLPKEIDLLSFSLYYIGKKYQITVTHNIQEIKEVKQ